LILEKLQAEQAKQMKNHQEIMEKIYRDKDHWLQPCERFIIMDINLTFM
jgi:hypothetical protein